MENSYRNLNIIYFLSNLGKLQITPDIDRARTSVLKLLYFAEIPSAIIRCSNFSGFHKIKLAGTCKQYFKLVHTKGLLTKSKKIRSFGPVSECSNYYGQTLLPK